MSQPQQYDSHSALPPSPDASTAAILGASSSGWSPQRRNQGFEGGGGGGGDVNSSPSRTGGINASPSRQFDPHALRSHGYVSNSIFKQLGQQRGGAAGRAGGSANASPLSSPTRSAAAATPLSSPRRRMGVGLGIGVDSNGHAGAGSPTRDAAQSDAENDESLLVTSPSSTHSSALAPRKSRGFEVLTKSSYVSNSPFKRGVDSEPSPQQTRPLSLRTQQQQSASPASKGLLNSNRLHGPRSMGADDSMSSTSASGDATIQQHRIPLAQRQRRKTVTFDESPDIQEFDRESSFDGSSLRSGDSAVSLQSSDGGSERGGSDHSHYRDIHDDDFDEEHFWTNTRGNNAASQRLMVVNGGASPDPSTSSPEIERHVEQQQQQQRHAPSSNSSNDADTADTADDADDSREISNSEASDMEPISPEPHQRILSAGPSPGEKSYATAADDTFEAADASHASLGLGGLQRVDSMVDELLQQARAGDENDDNDVSYEKPVRRGGHGGVGVTMADLQSREASPVREQPAAAAAAAMTTATDDMASRDRGDEAAVESELFSTRPPAPLAPPTLAAPSCSSSALPSLPNWSPLLMDDKPLPPFEDAESRSQPQVQAQQQEQRQQQQQQQQDEQRDSLPRPPPSPRRPGAGASGRPHISRDAVLERVAREKRAQAEAEQARHAAQNQHSKESPADLSFHPPASTHHSHSDSLRSRSRPSAPASVRPAHSMTAMPMPTDAAAATPTSTPAFHLSASQPEPQPTPLREAPEEVVSPLERLGEEILAQQGDAVDENGRAISGEAPKSPWFDSANSARSVAEKAQPATSNATGSMAAKSKSTRAAPPSNLTIPPPGIDADSDAPPSPALSVRSNNGRLAPSTLGPPPPAVSGDEYAEQIIARRRSKRGADGGAARRKRSMSTGDAAALRAARANDAAREADDPRPQTPTNNNSNDDASDRASVEADLQRSKLTLDTTVQHALDGGFGNGLSRDISRIFRDGDSPYKTTDRGAFAGVDDKVSHSRTAGDVDSGKAWRKLRRPSDINEYAEEMRAYRANENPKKAAGKVFVMIDSFHPANLPVPQQAPTRFYSIIDNGLHIVKTGTSLLRPGQDVASPIGLEFELIQHKNLEFNLTLFVQRDAHLQDPRTTAAAARPASPTKKTGSVTRSFMSKLLRSPKKESARDKSPERVEPLLSYMNREGAFGRVDLVFEQVASKCLGKCFTVDLPVRGVADQMSSISGQASLSSYRSDFSRNLGRSRGFMRLKLFYLPPMPSIPPKMLPQNLKECVQGMEAAKWHQSQEARLSGVLTQQGGDCATWRRRPLKAQGTYLICYNEVTKRPTVKIDLAKAVKIEEAWDPYDTKLIATGGKPRESLVARFHADEDPDESYHVARSFRVTFADGERISFFADTDEEKEQWIRVMAEMIGMQGVAAVPMWAQVAGEVIRSGALRAEAAAAAAVPAKSSTSSTASSAAAKSSALPPTPGSRGSGSSSLASRPPTLPATVQEESTTTPTQTPSPTAPGSPGKVHRKQVPGARARHDVQSASVSGPSTTTTATTGMGMGVGMGHGRAQSYSHQGSAAPAPAGVMGATGPRVPATPVKVSGSGSASGSGGGVGGVAAGARPRSELFTPVRKGSVAVTPARR